MADERSAIQAAMAAAFPQAEARVARFYAMQEYHLGWRDARLAPADSDPGKLIRPRLVLLACRAVGGDAAQALPLAAAIQLIHDFSLIHDDIEDDSATRRGRPTLWHLWGLAQGINAGDGMFVVAHRALYQLRDRGVAADVVLAIARRFDDTILTICEGQYLDLHHEGDLSIDEAAYLAMIARKTAALLGASASLGAMVAGATAPQVAALGEFGLALGIAFQIQDDVLGIWGEPADTGKPAAADLWRKKLSLPVIVALQHSPQRDQLAGLLGLPAPDAAAVARMLAIIDATAARATCEAAAAAQHRQALAALARLDGDPACVAQLRQIADGLLGRRG
ncbi:MAG: polyprenyl synthetase family protein [Chloroflexi bacterium]|nr:polyprenyl synthetase family protein [Chloroflexota bacterium]